MLIESGELAYKAAPLIAGLMADVLGWDEDRVQREISRCRNLVEAERTALAQARTSRPDLATA